MQSTGAYKRILAVKLADLGDLLAITPALQALRAAHPQARLDVMVQPSSANILRGLPFIDNIIEFDKFSFYSRSDLAHPGRLFATARFLLKMRLARYDAFAIFHHSTTRLGAWERAILAVAVNAKATAGLNNALPHAQVLNRLLTHHVPDRGFNTMHEANCWLEVAGTLGADANGGWRTQMALTDAHRQAATSLLQQEGVNSSGPIVAMHPGSGGFSPARRWPADRFAGVARSLIEQHNAQVMIIGGPDEVEMAAGLAALIKDRVQAKGNVHNIAGRTSLHETAAVIEQCKLFIGNDSGPMHMSVAVGTPVVAVFGPSNKEVWGPYVPPGEPNPHTVVARDLPCQPCFYRGLTIGMRDGCGPRPCLTGLGIAPVIAACNSKLSA